MSSQEAATSTASVPEEEEDSVPEEERPQPFEIVPGSTSNSTLVKVKGHLYIRDKIYGQKRFCKCRYFRECGARGYHDDDDFYLTAKHTLAKCTNLVGPDAEREANEQTEVLLFRKRLIKLAKTEHLDLSEIYAKEIEKSSPAVQRSVTFTDMKQAMKRSRAREYPSGLVTASAVYDYLEDQDNALSKYHHASIKMTIAGHEHIAVIFRSPDILNLLLEEIDKVFLDATFKTVPPGFLQAFNIVTEVDGVNTLLFTVLMTTKNYELYAEVLQLLKNDFLFFKPTQFMADFEAAIAKAVHRIFPEAELSGCQFHFCTALNRAARNPGTFCHLMY